MTPPIIHSFNIPYLFDFFYSAEGITRARAGYLIDAMMIEGGIMLWCGRQHVVFEVHALRAMCRSLGRFRSRPSRMGGQTV